MFDNHFSDKNTSAQDTMQGQSQSTGTQNQTMHGQSTGTQNQTAYSQGAQNPNSASRYQNGYDGYGGSYSQNTGQNFYGTNQSGYYQGAGGANGTNGSYQYGNTYPHYAGVEQGKHKDKKKKEKKPNSFLKKAAVCLSLGLLFGIFAGTGMFAVQAVTGAVIGNKTVEVTESDRVILEDEDEGNTAGTQTDDTAKAGGKTVQSGIRETDNISTIVADVSQVVKEVMPAIVSINNHYTEKMSYFGQTMTSEADASGSGIIVGQNDTELLIVSNYHVIADSDELTVQFVEGSEARASIKGTDPDMDLAVIAVPIGDVNSSTLQEIAVATLGNSDTLTVGEPAIAIGNSLGYGQSVTTGVISALNRSIQLSDGTDGTFIQTDAAINPGNSGGALLNMKGEVVGINSNKIGGSAVEGMGYAIPISAASPIIAELMLKETKNKVAEEERGYLGISGISVTQEVSAAYGMPEGVYISQVYENTAAAAAGLRKGDIIVEFGGDKISSMDILQKELEFYAKGDVVDVTVMSPGVGGYESRTVELTLGNKAQ
ncbi:MAG: PDZ domain-containing protein [Lachnospiraceae bacterium]|jgi:serine protease Do|nr:PDZ domain-containing protein [Lachnospiraceae bacterium]